MVVSETADWPKFRIVCCGTDKRAWRRYKWCAQNCAMNKRSTTVLSTNNLKSCRRRLKTVRRCKIIAVSLTKRSQVITIRLISRKTSHRRLFQRPANSCPLWRPGLKADSCSAKYRSKWAWMWPKCHRDQLFKFQLRVSRQNKCKPAHPQRCDTTATARRGAAIATCSTIQFSPNLNPRRKISPQTIKRAGIYCSWFTAKYRIPTQSQAIPRKNCKWKWWTCFLWMTRL